MRLQRGESCRTYFGGAVTPNDTVAAPLVAVELLETTPFESTPIIVKLYVFAGVVPLGAVVDEVHAFVVVLPQPGSIRIAPLRTNRATNPQIFRFLFSPVVAPRPTNPKIGIDSQNAKNDRLYTAAHDIGPKVLIVSVEDAVPSPVIWR